ncbi:MAG: methyl-accepting chemotaxis protein [Desulfovibrio sp.]|jgi:methyl-accepting chemotaxis protein|nr:methyl-accepting chemotaxis protein [Desulfovibrio sp.]
MTTKFKIILGFAVMNIIIIVLAVFCRQEMLTVSAGFDNYARAANTNTTLSDIATESTTMLLSFNRFLRTHDAKWIDTSGASAAHIVSLATDSASRTRFEERRKFFEDVKGRAIVQRDMIAKMAASVTTLRKAYVDKMRPAYHSIFDAFAAMTVTAEKVGNSRCLGIIGGMWPDLATAIGAMGRFYQGLGAHDMEEAEKSVTAMKKGIDALEPILTTDLGRTNLANIRKAYDILIQTAESLIAEANNMSKAMSETMAFGRDMDADIKKFNAVVDKQTEENEALTLATVSNAVTVIAYSGVGGFIVGVLMALFNIVTLVRTLSKVSTFATAVSEGDLDTVCDVKEKGEIGQMVGAISEIPKILLKLQEGFAMLTDKIEHGDILIRGRVHLYKGGFRKIVEGVNACIGRLNEIIDEIPSPVVVMDGDRKVRFLNKVGQQVAGTDYNGKVCKQLFNRDDDGTPVDALGLAIREKRPASAETVAHPQGKTMDIAYTAIPMFDEHGNLAMVLQLITDLSGIKAQQRTMMEVAKQAEEISNRVAAASEQLSSQVEQISRGAEIQRSRVESTASAMSEMNSTVVEVAGNASKASEQSELSKGKATEGAGLVEQVVRAINGVNTVSRKLQENMEELGKQAEAIGGVMGVISDIADQTNLLALNAAIEAARAGEAGRGFAVVADEVRKLAEKTMTATQEVGSSIGAIQQSAKSNMEAVAGAVHNVEEATTLANRSGDALKEIVDMSATNAAVVTSIATAAEEQSATSEEIAKALEEINRIVGETTDGMVQSSQAVQDLSRMAQELNSVMTKLRA